MLKVMTVGLASLSEDGSNEIPCSELKSISVPANVLSSESKS